MIPSDSFPLFPNSCSRNQVQLAYGDYLEKYCAGGLIEPAFLTNFEATAVAASSSGSKKATWKTNIVGAFVGQVPNCSASQQDVVYWAYARTLKVHTTTVSDCEALSLKIGRQLLRTFQQKARRRRQGVVDPYAVFDALSQRYQAKGSVVCSLSSGLLESMTPGVVDTVLFATNPNTGTLTNLYFIPFLLLQTAPPSNTHSYLASGTPVVPTATGGGVTLQADPADGTGPCTAHQYNVGNLGTTVACQNCLNRPVDGTSMVTAFHLVNTPKYNANCGKCLRVVNSNNASAPVLYVRAIDFKGNPGLDINMEMVYAAWPDLYAAGTVPCAWQVVDTSLCSFSCS